MIGRRFKSLIDDSEHDDQFGLVVHPKGATFVVDQALGNDHYMVAWEQTVLPSGMEVPSLGMWTIWTDAEIFADAVEVS